MEETLETKIETIRKVLDIDQIVALSADTAYIQKYYRLNIIPYSLFHNSLDRVHMGISHGDIYKEDDLLGAAQIVSSYIRENKTKRVLELATGRGADSLYLAEQFPETDFYGIDLSPAHVARAQKKASKVNNYHPEGGDYHDLRRFEEASFDIVFVFEALSCSTDKDRVLREVSRVLKIGGRFIVVDGYLKKDERLLTGIEMLACTLVEKGMAVQDFENYASFLEKATRRLKLLREEDLSMNVMPTMRRFERLGRRFFHHPYLAKAIAMVIPKEIINNAVTGYLMPTAMEQGLYSYMVTILEK